MKLPTQNRPLTDEEVLENLAEEKLTVGQRVADKVAAFGGSWGFIISFFSFILIWIALNVFILMNKGFDPYPFILLNLLLSCLAAIQAPIIMMSQNRMEEKDRARAIRDYNVNLKAELEIIQIMEKLEILMQQHEEHRAENKATRELVEQIQNEIKK